MPDWNQVVDRFFEMSDPENAYDHHSPSGASIDEVEALQSRMGISFPAEFHDLYRNFNGVGLIDRDEQGDMPLFLRPIYEIPSYIEQCRSTFAETHPGEARRYFPFIDWFNGDSSGYWLNRDGELEPFICTFFHERYAYVPEQDVAEFIQPQAHGIADLLSPE